MLQVTWEPYADEAALPFVVSNVCDSDSELLDTRARVGLGDSEGL
jgi:hypothetical protein